MGNVKIPSNFFELDKLRLLETYVYCDGIILVLLKLITKSKRIKNRRFIYKVADNIELTDNLLAHLFRIDETICRDIFDTLNELGFIMRGNIFIEVFRFWEDEQRNRSTPEYKNWRMEVFKRDNYICQGCKSKGGNLNAHHIIAWADSRKERFNIDNGTTLCEECHKEVHKRR